MNQSLEQKNKDKSAEYHYRKCHKIPVSASRERLWRGTPYDYEVQQMIQVDTFVPRRDGFWREMDTRHSCVHFETRQRSHRATSSRHNVEVLRAGSEIVVVQGHENINHNHGIHNHRFHLGLPS